MGSVRARLIIASLVVLGFSNFLAAQNQDYIPISIGESIRLDNGWTYYPDQLLTLSEIIAQENDLNLSSQNKISSKFGFGTYSLLIHLTDSAEYRTIVFPPISSSCKIFLNNKEIVEIGKVSDHKDDYRSGMKRFVYDLPSGMMDFHIIIQVANFELNFLGMTSSPYLGISSKIREKLEIEDFVEALIYGGLFITFIYQISLFIFFRRGRAYFWLAIFSFLVLMRCISQVEGLSVMGRFFPSVTASNLLRSVYFFSFLLMACFSNFIHTLFPSKGLNWINYLFITASLILTVISIFAAPYVVQIAANYGRIIILIIMCYSIFFLSRSALRKAPGSKLTVYGLSLSFPIVGLGVLQESRVFDIGIPHLYGIATLVFLIFQSFTMASQYDFIFSKVEELSSDLERSVVQKTRQLLESNKIKEKLLSLLSHDLKGPIGSLRAALELNENKQVSEEELKLVKSQIKQKLDKSYDLLDNLLSWAKLKMKGANATEKSFNLKQTVESVFNLFSEAASTKKIVLLNKVEKAEFIEGDEEIVKIVLRNLVSNAIKFTLDGKITIDSLVDNDNIIIRVSDTGRGMSDEKLRNLFNPKMSQSEDGTNKEIGTGIGLIFCKDFIESGGGRLLVQSARGKGTTFSFSVKKYQSPSTVSSSRIADR